MNEHEVIDSRFLESMAGKQPFLKRMFTVFISQEPKRIREIKEALESRDVERLRHLAHALKGGAATMGVERVRDCCLNLENASKAQDLDAAMAPSRRPGKRNAQRLRLHVSTNLAEH